MPPSAPTPERRERRLRRLARGLAERLVLWRTVAAVAVIALVGTVAVVTFTGPGPVLLGFGKASVDEEPREATVGPPREEASALEEPSVGEDAGSGEASYYGPGLEGNPTASGEVFDPERLTAAHRTLPLGSRVRVTNTRNGRSVVVRINDRGPFEPGRIIDLSEAAAREIGLLETGTGRVKLELLR